MKSSRTKAQRAKLADHSPAAAMPARARAEIRRLSLLATLMTLALPSLAQAQQGAQEPASEMNDAAVLPVVKVKARSTNESQSYTAGASQSATGLTLSLRDTPQSVTVITQQRISDQAMTQISDVLRSTPGVSFKETDRGRNSLSVRGFDIDSFQYDGVPVSTGNIGGETGSTVIYERVEVVRGATGLLSGAGNPSASVNLVRKRADSKVFVGSAQVSLGSWQHRGLTLDLSTPLSEDGRVRGRVVASHERQDAFIDLENTRRSMLYGVIDADLGTATRLSVGVSSQDDKRNGVYWGGLTYWYADGSPTRWDRSKTTATRWNQWDTRQQTVFAKLSHQFDNLWRVSLDLNHYKQREESMLLWMTGMPDRDTGLGLIARPYHYRATPVQNQLALTATGPFQLWGREHELTMGLSHSTAKGGWDNGDPLDQQQTPVGDFNRWDGSYARPAMKPLEVGSSDTTTQVGAYAAARLQLSDPLKLILGGRISNWKQDNRVGAWTANAFTIKHSKEFTPYAGLVFDLNKELSLYASYTNIFKPQNARDNNGKYLDPLTGKSYEGGIKGELLDGRLNASAAVFRIDQDNFAVPAGTVGETTIPAMRALKGVRVQGYELEVSGELARDWSIGAGWTQFSAKNANSADLVAPDHPRKLLKLFSKYTLGGSLQGFSVGGGVNWESAQLTRLENPVTKVNEHVGQPSYALVDLMLRYEFSKKLSLQANVDNLLDKKYYSSGWSGYTYGKPRGLTLTLSHTL